MTRRLCIFICACVLWCGVSAAAQEIQPSTQPVVSPSGEGGLRVAAGELSIVIALGAGEKVVLYASDENPRDVELTLTLSQGRQVVTVIAINERGQEEELQQQTSNQDGNSMTVSGRLKQVTARAKEASTVRLDLSVPEGP